MRFEAATDYPASAEAVATMFADPEYVRLKVAASGATSSTEEVTPAADGGFTVTTKRAMPTDRVPAKFRSFVGNSVEMRFIEVWSAAAADGRRTATITLDIIGAPGRATGTAVLDPRGADASAVRYEGEVKVSIPLVGAPIERAAVGAVQGALNAERRVGLEWLTQA